MEKNKRLYSLDALRGFDMLFISGLASLIVAVCSLFPGGAECALAANMDHVEWNGLAHHDTIFPLFLFIAGVSWPFSYSKQLSAGVSKGFVYLKIFKRAAALIFFGLLYNGLLMDFEHIRIFSVLGRIGLAWMFASLLYINLKKPALCVAGIGILVGYWFLCMIPAPDTVAAAGGAYVDPLSKEGCLVGWIDRTLFPNLLYNGENFDPEGLLSTLPAIVTALLGMLTGDLLRKDEFSGNRKTVYMLIAAAVLLGIGLLWSHWFPINKKLWTSSFVLVVGAYSVAMSALFYWIIDVRGHSSWAFPLKVVGMNSIAIYMLPRFIHFDFFINFFLGGVIKLCPVQVGSVIFSSAWLLLSWLLVFLMYRKNIFLKL